MSGKTWTGPKENTLYFCDNGACYCWLHLGSSARATGRDISGQKIEIVSKSDNQYLILTCHRPARCEIPSCSYTYD